MKRQKSQNLPIQRVFLDQHFDKDVAMYTDEFWFIFRFLGRFEINYDEDVLLMVESSPDALITMLVDFIDEYHHFIKKKIQ